MRRASFVIATIMLCSRSPEPPPEPSAPPSSTTTVQPTPSAPPVGTLPVGRVVFDRSDTGFGSEAPYLGTFIVGGEGTEELVPTDLEVEHLTAVWSPDGDQLLVTTWTPPRGPSRPGIMLADGSRFTPLDPGGLPADLSCNAWSPEGKILLCSIEGGQDHPELDGIYTMPAAGGVPTRLTTSPEHGTIGDSGECGGGDHVGDYSPDGTEIVFLRVRCGNGPDPSSDQTGALFVANADGSGLERIVEFGVVNSHRDGRARWSPDGDHILFGTEDGVLSVVRPDGSELTPIALETGGHAYAPDWSPDGRYIVFSMWLEGTRTTDLYVVDADGSNLIQITDTDGSEDFANWGPGA